MNTPTLADLISSWLKEKGWRGRLSEINEFHVLSKKSLGNVLWISDQWVSIPNPKGFGDIPPGTGRLHVADPDFFEKLENELKIKRVL